MTWLKACDGTCVSLPDPTTWGGGVWCKSGSAVAFDTDSAGTAERVLTVPYKSATPETIYPVTWVEEQWWSTSRQYNNMAEDCLARNVPVPENAVRPYGDEGMLRLRVAGLKAYSVWIFHKKHGFQRAPRNAITHWWIAPPAEDGPGYPLWMGPPVTGPSGSFASDAAQDLNQVPNYGVFDGHESEISGPFADPSVGPSTKPTRTQLSAGGSSSRPPRVSSEAPSALSATDAPATGAAGGEAAALSTADAPAAGAAGGKAAQQAASTPAAVQGGKSTSTKSQKSSGKGEPPQPKPKGDAARRALKLRPRRRRRALKPNRGV